MDSFPLLTSGCAVALKCPGPRNGNAGVCPVITMESPARMCAWTLVIGTGRLALLMAACVTLVRKASSTVMAIEPGPAVAVLGSAGWADGAYQTSQASVSVAPSASPTTRPSAWVSALHPQWRRALLVFACCCGGNVDRNVGVLVREDSNG